MEAGRLAKTQERGDRMSPYVEHGRVEMVTGSGISRSRAGDRLLTTRASVRVPAPAVLRSSFRKDTVCPPEGDTRQHK